MLRLLKSLWGSLFGGGPSLEITPVRPQILCIIVGVIIVLCIIVLRMSPDGQELGHMGATLAGGLIVIAGYLIRGE